MTTVAIVLIVSVFAFAVLGVPLAWSLGLSSLCAILTTGTISLGMLAQRMYTGGAVYAFLAIFFFVFAGNIMTYGGLSKRLIRFANGLVGHHTGGTSIVCTLACTFFAAISGSSIATTAAIGGMLYPELKDYGYPDDYAATLPAVGGVLGIVIPPSVTFIVYGTTLNISVGKLLFSGVVPGILGSIALSVMCYIFAKKRNYPKGEKMNRKEFWKVAWEAGPALLTPLIILGGIYSGLFTPTESAAVATLYSIIATKFFYKELDWSIYKQAMRDTTQTTANIMILVMSATCFSWLLTVNNIPHCSARSSSALSTQNLPFGSVYSCCWYSLECSWMFPLLSSLLPRCLPLSRIALVSIPYSLAASSYSRSQLVRPLLLSAHVSLFPAV